jgi:hypothetical protein
MQSSTMCDCGLSVHTTHMPSLPLVSAEAEEAEEAEASATEEGWSEAADTEAAADGDGEEGRTGGAAATAAAEADDEAAPALPKFKRAEVAPAGAFPLPAFLPEAQKITQKKITHQSKRIEYASIERIRTFAF